MDKVYKFEDLKVFVDATSAMYLSNCTVDYVEDARGGWVQVRECRGEEHLRLRIELQRLIRPREESLKV